MKIAIVNNGTAQNKGCQALTRSIIDLFSDCDYPPEFFILTHSPRYDRKVFGNEKAKVNFSSYPNFSRKASLALSCRKLIPKSFFIKNISSLGYIFKNDVIISSGGDTLTSDYNPKRLKYYLDLLQLAIDFGKPVYIMAASLGPFLPNILPYAKKVLNSVDLITVRETQSYHYLKNIGIKKNVRITADPAFLMTATEVPFLENKLTSDRLKIGFSLSRGIIQYSKLDYSSTLIQFINTFKVLEKKFNPIFILVPHVIDTTNSDNDDREFCDAIYRSIGNPDNFLYANLDFTCTELKYIISKCDIFIGARTHSTIASLSSFVPTISLAYSQKAYGINLDLFGNNDFVLPIKKFTEKILIQKIESILSHREKIQNMLKNKIPEIKKLSGMNKEYFDDHFKNG